MSRAGKAVTTAADELTKRLALLAEVTVDGDGRLAPVIVDRARVLHATAATRLGHGTAHTVVALAGATGSGKSTLFNAISRTDFATVGVRRPTTSQPLAIVFGDGAEDLLDWLAIPQRQRLTDASLDGLVLVDLPDHDSTESANRAEVDRLVQVVDLFVWVVDPQKYADAALHDQYLQRFAGHGAVTIVVLNQIDRLSPSERTACLDDLAKLLAADGLNGVRVMPASGTTGEGVDGLRRELSARVAERQALERRLDADLDWLVGDLASAVGDGGATKVPERSVDALVDAATDAAGGAEIEYAVDLAYRRRAALAVGWPPVRWVRKVKADPLARLGLGTRLNPTAAKSETGTVNVRLTAIQANPLATARLGEALRALSRDATAKLPDHPRAAVERRVAAAEAGLPDALDRAASRTDLHVEAARWWTLIGTVQRLATAALVAGLAWLAMLFVIGWFHLPDPPLPRLRTIPLPTWLALGGALVGIALATLGRRVAAVGARRRSRKARAALATEVAKVVRSQVVAPVDEELAALARLGESVRRLAR